MTLLIETPYTRSLERDYILSVILGEFLGQEWKRVPSARNDVQITLQGHQGKIRIPDDLFQIPDEVWLTTKSLPEQPLSVWDSSELGLSITLTDKYLPIIYGNQTLSHVSQTITINCSPLTINLPIDVFGSAFFMLTRYEEVIKLDRDERARFPAWASLACQEGFLDRPIIDEYTEVLWAAMKRLWPGLERKKRTYKVHLSHDVDSVLYTPFARPISLLKQVAGDALKRKNLGLARRRARSFLRGRHGNYDEDPYNTFDFIMTQSEKYSLKSAFYFMVGGNTPRDAKYDINMPWVKNLIKVISERGHEVGIHPSYETYLDPTATFKEFQTLLSVARECGIHQNEWGGRQHNLRWSPTQTWKNWDEAGLTYDSTLTYAQHAGFRCGCCHEYSVYDLKTRKPLLLKERPLVVMEGSLLNKNYMNLDFETSKKSIKNLADRCKVLQGNFTLLYHNSKLTTERDLIFYENLIAQIT